jgi:hypothetical protein
VLRAPSVPERASRLACAGAGQAFQVPRSGRHHDRVTDPQAADAHLLPGRQSRRPRGKVQRQAVGVGSEKVEIAAARRAILDQDLQRSSSSTGASMPPCPLARAGARASIDSRRSAGVEEAARAAPPERRNETAAREREARPYGAREREETGSAEK